MPQIECHRRDAALLRFSSASCPVERRIIEPGFQNASASRLLTVFCAACRQVLENTYIMKPQEHEK